MFVLQIKFKTLPTVILVLFLLFTLRNHLPLATRFQVANNSWVTPNIYQKGDKVEIIVNKVESDLTQLPYAYYDLPFTCPPSNFKKPLHLSLNEIIRGDRKWQSDYELKFGEDMPCKILCARKTNKEGMKTAIDLIKKGYVAQWLIDEELPAATTFISTKDQKKYYGSGFPLGYYDEDTGTVYLHNHLMFVIRFHATDDNNFTIVGFEVYPRSVSDYSCPGARKDYENYELVVPEADDELQYLPFTYSVYWREEFDVEWKDRFKFFFNNGELSDEITSKFHWISLANSIGIVILASFIVAFIFIKVSLKDRTTQERDTYETNILADNTAILPMIAENWLNPKGTRWIHMLIVMISMGVQCIFTIIGALAISCSLNKLHDVRNSVLSMTFVFFILGAAMASYVGSYLLIQINMRSKSTVLNDIQIRGVISFSILCGCLLPGLVMTSTLILNSIVWAHDSTNALPFGTIVLIVFMYFLVCIPLSYIGGQLAVKSLENKRVKMSSHTNDRAYIEKSGGSLTRFRSKKKKLLIDSFTILLILISGIFPFIIIYVELQFVYKSVWLEKTTFYYYYGFLLANILLLCIVICEISIIVCYVMMTITSKKEADEVDWRWKVYQAGSSPAWYMELYSLYYIFWVLNIRGFSSILLSVCYSTIFNVICGFGMGSLGYLSSYFFIRYVSHSRTKTH
ncbi:similar to Saccharomyces cerevisiae YER113C TMN3 Protein with a role in cellular adhesion and filamentous growth [Maudiozyma barnettii]|uniref:Transmembrane 9 superfamily member n=1 Tax=Maudiozyma barnettii TaxID=61262 RepID=A0A8H2VBD2_9SACH|nr:Tmn3p [Kazachstania barnettii]CAB4252156.1 similar to Saccharomyces cerevisiae YER113C TMN3 Protein with a role in cellular adhesion and filamentous growth [Kazachstania barnettii]CAD1778729.1 similar to Saccharomyces cerevisiae YER113C TMN3 Protein with a role in cellular adhesion and filamentous growth [Kazachstania barnettii]